MRTAAATALIIVQLALLAFLQGALGAEPVADHSLENGESESYLNLGADLGRLRDDFNANEGKIRLLFVVGPTCGVCLRGMADLNDEILASMQGENRLHTYVVHVPTLGATAEHVPDAMSLLDGPKVTHYWNGTGMIGVRYQDVLGLPVYAWDIWLIYDADAVWDRDLPPAPNFWQHQLGPLRVGQRLDVKKFHVEVERYLSRTD